MALLQADGASESTQKKAVHQVSTKKEEHMTFSYHDMYYNPIRTGIWGAFCLMGAIVFLFSIFLENKVYRAVIVGGVVVLVALILMY